MIHCTKALETEQSVLEGYGQHDYYRQQNAYGHERHVEYGSGFNDGESRPRDHGASDSSTTRYSGVACFASLCMALHWMLLVSVLVILQFRLAQTKAAMLIGVTVLKASPTVGSGTTPITKTTGKGGAITGTIGMNVANVTDRRDRDRRDRDDLHNSAGDHGPALSLHEVGLLCPVASCGAESGFDRRAGHGPARDDDRTLRILALISLPSCFVCCRRDSDHRRGHEGNALGSKRGKRAAAPEIPRGHSDPRPPKGAGKGGAFHDDSTRERIRFYWKF